MYTGTKLIELLEKQHQNRGQSDLFKKGTFTIQWRAKVGSYLHPDGETMISAGEPCGNWTTYKQQPRKDKVVDKNDKERTIHALEQYLNELHNLPINGYIPGSSIRGLVRAWAKKYPDKFQRMNELLGYQDDEKIVPGKIEFLDAYPQKATPLTLDIVNPQQEFQVLHSQKKQSNPCPLYTLGNGEDKITVTIAIRGIVNKTKVEEVQEVWEWVEQALSLYGIGSRTASGYGAIQSSNKVKLIRPLNESVKIFEFILYSQGCYGVTQQNRNEVELRPSHWRGWLRSWVWRFLLGVMSENNARKTLGELLGNIDEENATNSSGCIRLTLIKSKKWGEYSPDQPRFYTWKGRLKITAPNDILPIILPIIKFAVSVGGVGRGWRRPLHIFQMKKTGYDATRGCYLKIFDVSQTNELRKPLSYQLSPNKPEEWLQTYQQWFDTVHAYWTDRVITGVNETLQAEVFSPTTVFIYAVPGPDHNPLDESYKTWEDIRRNEDTRGDGMQLIYKDKYKKKTDVGGNAGDGNAHCSWVSIKRVNVPHKNGMTDCQEIVCLFMGGESPDSNHLRSQFLKDLSEISGSTLLFGLFYDQKL